MALAGISELLCEVRYAQFPESRNLRTLPKSAIIAHRETRKRPDRSCGNPLWQPVLRRSLEKLGHQPMAHNGGRTKGRECHSLRIRCKHPCATHTAQHRRRTCRWLARLQLLHEHPFIYQRRLGNPGIAQSIALVRVIRRFN